MSKKIVVGITGSIAAFKAVQFISDLYKKGFIIDVVMSESAAKFITPICIQSLTKRKVYIDTFDEENPAIITHIDIVKDADLFVIIPASAQTIAKLAYGFADNMLTCAFLAATCPKLIAPAMNVNMYNNPITQNNIQLLKNCGVLFVEPASGMLACGDIGKGKLAELNEIFEMVDYALSPKPLLNKNVLINAGPTQEAIDPVRFITNHSSGTMGYSLAKAAFCLGAHVTLVSGPTYLKKPYGVNCIDVVSAKDMYDAIIPLSKENDYIILSAAVADYTSKVKSNEKIKKNDCSLQLELMKTKDILFELGKNKTEHQIICGFAMETENLIENAKNKLLKKNCDMIVANSLKVEGAGFKTSTNVATFVKKDDIIELPLMSKEELSFKILYELMDLEG